MPPAASESAILLAYPVGPNFRRTTVTIAAVIIAGLILLFVSAGDYKPLLYVGAALALVASLAAAPYSWRHPQFLPFISAALYLVTMLSPLNETVRALLHYCCLVLFGLPLVPRLFRSGLLQAGGFRLYCYYFAWAAITCIYSLAPTFSMGRLIAATLGFTMAAVSVLAVDTVEEARKLILNFFYACAIFVAISVVSLGLPHSLTWQSPLESFQDGSGAATLATVPTDALDDINRFRGLFGNPNAIGELMLATVASALVCWRGSSRRQKYLFSSVTGAAVVVAVLADSRSALGGLLLGCTLYVFWRYRSIGLLSLAITALIGGAVLFKSGHFSAYANRGLGNLTGRTDIWAYAVSKIRERPLLGYGYQVSGAIFSSRFFPLWYGPWDQGPHSSLHDGYIGYAVGVGIPATLLWLYLTARSWVFVFRQTADPWNLKLVALVVVVPALIYNFTEASIIDFYGLLASLFGLSWALAERFRLRTLAAEKQASSAAFDALPAAAQALQGAAWSR